ncbi:hypothetical protein Tco_1313436 [Tanacetum coccineum]
MKKLEAELWNLKVKGTDVIGYNQRFQELALLCVRMFPEEFDKVERTPIDKEEKGKEKTVIEYGKEKEEHRQDEQGMKKESQNRRREIQEKEDEMRRNIEEINEVQDKRYIGGRYFGSYLHYGLFEMTLSLSSERSLYNALTLLHPDYEASCPSRPVTSLNQVFIASSSDAGGAFLWGYLCQESIGAYGFGISIMPPRKDQNGTTLAYKNPTPQSVTKPNFCNGLTKALTALATLMFSEESDKIEKYVGGLPDMIHGSVMASRPKTMQDAIEMETELMDKKISTLAERQAENKRKLDNNN